MWTPKCFERCGPGPNDGTLTSPHSGRRIGTSATSDCNNGCFSPKSGTSSDGLPAWIYSKRKVYPLSGTLRYKPTQSHMIQPTPTISWPVRVVVVRADRVPRLDALQQDRRSSRRVLTQGLG